MAEEIGNFFDCECDEFVKGRLKDGLFKTSKFIFEHAPEGGTVLEIGCGPGDLTLKLAAAGAPRVRGVDVSGKMIQQARVWAKERKLADRSTFEKIEDLDFGSEEVELVILDRVICCYPDWKGMIEAALPMSKGTLAVAIPRDGGLWGPMIRVLFFFGGLKRGLMGDPFRTFLHPTRMIEARILEDGFRVKSRWKGGMWRVDIYERSGSAS